MNDWVGPGMFLLFATLVLLAPRVREISILSLLPIPLYARLLYIVLPALCFIFICVVLRSFAAADVRDDPGEVVFYAVLGMLWVTGAEYSFQFFGVSLSLDGMQRRNPAALWAGAGGLAGVACCYAGANIGDGPGAVVVVFCALLSTGTLFLFWVILHSATRGRLNESITVDRDTPTGIRLGAYLLSLGIMLGGAVAGDWVSFSRTLSDFVAYAWPAIWLVVLVALFERPQRASPVELPGSILLSAICLASAAGYVACRGLR